MKAESLIDVASDLTRRGKDWSDYSESVFLRFVSETIQALNRIGIGAVRDSGDAIVFFNDDVSLDEAETFFRAFGRPISRDELEARATLIEMAK